jgi:hypothetical protein
MAAQKLEKALYGPSLMEVILGVILGLLAGVVAACVFLVFKPVPTVPTLPKEAKDPLQSTVYFVPGSTLSGKSRNWQLKQKQLIAGTAVLLVEDELNAWAMSLPNAAPAVPAKPVKPAKPAKPGEAAPSTPAPEGYIIPATPNFRIVDGRLTIGLKCTLNWYGLMQDVTVQTTGTFRKDGDQFTFVPETVYLGSCPLHMLPAASNLLLSTIAAKLKIPDEIRAAWAKLNIVALEGSTLKLAVQ